MGGAGGSEGQPDRGRRAAPLDPPPAVIDLTDAPTACGASDRRAPVPPGRRILATELQPGDRAHLPLLQPDGALRWSGAVTVTAVLVIDAELVQVRWLPPPGGDPFAAHVLLIGTAYAAGVILAA